MSRRTLSKTISYLILVGGALIVAFPFIWMLFTSLKTNEEARSNKLILVPESPQFENYATAWDGAGTATFTTYFRNSMITATLVTLGVLVTSILSAYAFANMEFRGKRLIFILFLSTMMIPFEVTLVPNYQTIQWLGWLDTFPALIVPWMANVFSIFIIRQFFRMIPRDYFEAAQLDGCGHWRYMWQIAVPMASPAIVTVTIFTFLGSWNALLWPLLVTTKPGMRVVQVGLSLLQSDNSPNLNILMAASAIVILPVLLLYLFLQRRFIEGVSGTGLKG